MTNLIWKLSVALTLALSIYAIWDNGRRVLRLERQVCDTLYESNARLDEIAYYREHPAEKQMVLDDNRRVLMRFHCPSPEKGATP